MSRALRLCGLLLVLVLAASCRRHHHSGGGSSPPPPPPPPVGPASVPTGAATPVGLTWLIGFNDNVSQAAMDAWYAKMVTLSTNLWNVSEGQVYLAKVVISDAVSPGFKASTLFGFSAPPEVSALDVCVFVGSTWDLGGVGGFVIDGAGIGREDRIMGVPEGAGDLTLVHEGSHMVFRLTWSAGPLLTDEYADGTQDAACIMELAFSPLKWCSATNHVAQSSQPTSCWSQVLTDYATFAYGGTDTAAGPPPATIVEYNDTP